MATCVEVEDGLKERVEKNLCLLSRDQVIEVLCNLMRRESELNALVKELLRDLGRVA